MSFHWPWTLRSIRASVAIATGVICLAFAGESGIAAEYAEIVLPFPQSRPYSAKYDAIENLVKIEILKTSSTELQALEHYDEEMVRRVLVKDRGSDGVEVLIKLKSRDIVATVNDFDEPFRIVIELFRRGYTPGRSAEALPTTVTAPVAQARTPAGPTGIANLPATPATTDHVAQRRIFQTAPKKFENAADLCAQLKQAKPGLAPSWGGLADPVYRLDNLPAKPKYAEEIPLDVCQRSMASTRGLSDLAAALYADGQELRAMFVYQQLLFHDPLAIERDAGNLWRMAEIHLGQGNLSLAGGYYDAIAKRFPGTPEHSLALLRLIDLQAIEAMAAGESDILTKVSPALSALDVASTTPDYRAGKVLRTAYWRGLPSNSPVQGEDAKTAIAIPALDEMDVRELESTFSKLTHPRTRFLTASMLLAARLDPRREWNADTGNFAANYFRDYKTAAFDPMRSELLVRLRTRIDQMIQKLSMDGRHVDVVQTFELLPKPLQSVRKNPKTAWALGESYRSIGQPQPAVAFYQTAAAEGSGIDRFKAQFWLSQTASEATDLLTRMKAGQTKISPFQRAMVDADRSMAATLAGLKPSEREQLYAAFRQPIEASLTSGAKLRTPPKLILSSWKDHHAARQSTSAGGSGADLKNEFSPSAASATLISNLAARFATLGMDKERRDALGLLRDMKPAQFGDDKEARKAWMDQLLLLAEEYRKDNEYLEAGRTFGLVASESENWEGRAETLYKAGLLLYRAGRKDEAVVALEKAKADGNNLFYANLATERLTQIQKK